MVDSVNNKISGAQVALDRAQTQERAKAKEDNPPPASVESDVSVELSQDANHIQQVREAAEAAPEVRDERVAQIRDQIAAGELKVNAQNIALQLILE
ncbi:MAG: Anti-sigma-28 factor, FlgM [Pseudomonadota bacterium]|jgi:flagellar biosynthesis anti-sigma factor FlgM